MNIKIMVEFKLNEIITFNTPESIQGGSIAKKVAMEKLIPFCRNISGYEYANYSSGPKFRNGDTLVAKITPCLENGKTAYVDVLEKDEVAFGSSEFIVLRAKPEKIDGEFLFYLAALPAFRYRAISCMEGTSGRKRVNEGTLENYSMKIPDIAAQRKIATILSAIDRKIQLNRQINSELQNQRTSTSCLNWTPSRDLNHYIPFFQHEGKTSGIKNFLLDSFLANYWVFPPDQIAKAFNERIAEFFKLRDKNMEGILQLSKLRDELLPLLMNGQVTVRDTCDLKT